MGDRSRPLELMAGPNEDYTMCHECGFGNLASSKAVWTDDGSSFCPDCYGPVPASPAPAGEPVAPEGPDAWLIRKGSYYYRPNCQGYTVVKAEAGRYTEARAKAESAVEPWNIVAVRADDVAGPATPPSPSDARAAALEEAAKAVEAHADDRGGRDRPFDWHDGYMDGCRFAAAAIRALGGKDNG